MLFLRLNLYFNVDVELVPVESCVPEEKWVNIHQHNNTSPSDVKGVVRATVGLKRSKSQAIILGNTTDSNGISSSEIQSGFVIPV